MPQIWKYIIQAAEGCIALLVGVVAYSFGQYIYKNRKKCKIFNYGNRKKERSKRRA